MARLDRVISVLLFGLLASACSEPNPAYLGKVAADGAPGKDTPVAPVDQDGASADAVVLPTDAPGADGPAEPADTGLDVPKPGLDGSVTLDGGGETSAIDAREAGRPTDLAIERWPDLADVPGDPIPPVDGRDGADGSLPGVDGGGDVIATGLDGGADLAPICQEGQARVCSSPGNPLIGACHPGKQACSNGAWGPCKEEILPANAESCNGLDDDCDGQTDEGCTADCVVVAPNGDDAGDGTSEKPLATVQKALEVAAAVDGGGPRRVCVAGGATCADTAAIYEQGESLAIPNGAKVQGNYALSDGTLTYCPQPQTPTTTLKFKVEGASVSFSSAVTTGAELGGFAIERAAQGSVSTGSAPVVGVSVNGARNVSLSGLHINDAPIGDATYGVLVEGGGQATVVGSSISGGQGKTAAVGVYASNGSVNLRNNCDKVKNGNCVADCAGGVLGIRGRSPTSTVDGAMDSSAVFVANKPGAASSIVGNLLCGGPGGGNGNVLAANVATLRCEGAGCATVSGNAIGAGTGGLSLAVAFVSGAGLVEANAITLGCGKEESVGVLLDGSGARLRNNRITGTTCSDASAGGSFVGVRVALVVGGGEPELHSNDIDPAGNLGDCESFGILVERRSGADATSGILRNNIVGTGNCEKRFSVYENGSVRARVVENNDLYPSPSAPSAATTILYRRASTDATTVAQVNAFAGAAANISLNPKFVSYPNDLHLTGESPCLDVGTAEGAPASDGDWLARPQGAGFDIGAYELVKP